MTLETFIRERSEEIEKLESSSNISWWNLATSGEEKFAEELEVSSIALRTLYSSPSDYQFLLDTPTDADADALVTRQKSVLLQRYSENQISHDFITKITALETDIEATYTNFRPIVRGKALSNNDLKKILVESSDLAERQQAWEASKLIGETVEKNVLELIALRNDAAKLAGFSDYYSMRLQLQELDQSRLFSLLDELHKLTAPHWAAYKTQLDTALAERYNIRAEDLLPWHYQDPFFQEAPQQQLDLNCFYEKKDAVAICKAFFHTIGLPVDDILAASDLYEREKKNQHAFCTCIDHKRDVRILCNLRDNEYWMGTLLHELGHGVYDKYIDQNLPYLLRTPAHISTTEAIAMLFGRLSKDAAFLQRYVGVEREKVKEIEKAAKAQLAANLLVFARWTLVMIHFEQAMYQQQGDGVDLNSLWWDCVEKYQSVKRVTGRDKPDWASKLHLACAPVYYQNYILGEMTASQLSHHLQQRYAEDNGKGKELYTDPSAGDFLKSALFALGATLPWDEALASATGELLTPQYFAYDLQS